MNIFSTDAFLLAAAEAWFPGRPFRIGHYRTGGRVFRLVCVDGREPVTRLPFLDFVQPLDVEPDEPIADLAYIPRAALSVREVSEQPAIAPGTFPSPFIDWSRFADWAAFEAHFAARRPSLPGDSRRKRARLERDLGPVRFVFDDPAPEALERCMAWKSRQYGASGVTDVFAQRENVELFRLMRARGAVVVSSLRAGDTLLAAHLGGIDEERLYWWVPAYDPAFGRYSPGRLLLEALMREGQARRREFDFLIGDEDYKWHYATHDRVIGPLGTPPLSLVLKKAARSGLRRTLGVFPPLLDAARRLRRRLAT